ncbi:MAG: 23S rRNA (uracil(1939)-C(5))-methyltransferase RlmD [Candidatus Xenobia bacterium]
MVPALHQKHRVTLSGLAAGGEAIGRLDGFVLFVPDGVPGDQVEVEITEVKKAYGRARITQVLEPSSTRVEPPCPVFWECGGCQLQHIDYPTQLALKTRIVEDAVRHVARLKDVPVETCLGMDRPWSYRNKVQFVVAHGPTLGLYARGTHRVVGMETCAIQHPLNNQVLQTARDALRVVRWQPFDEASGQGVLRYIVARVTEEPAAVMVTFVVTHADVPRKSQLIGILRSQVPGLRGVLLNVNERPGNTILGARFETLWGVEHLEEHVAGLAFRISARSFFQVNRTMLLRMYETLERLLPLTKDDVVLDGYCGTGTLSLPLARRAGQVVGIEAVAPAIDDARDNAALNGFTNVRYEVGTVEGVLPRLNECFTAATIDPPRKGCEPVVLETFARMGISRIAYVSCNPVTLARDLGRLSELGYTTRLIQPLDMFPQTAHVECVAQVVRA